MPPPVEPPPTPWSLPEPADVERWPDDDLVAVGADLEPGTLLAAYRRGLFPMPLGPALEEAASRSGRYAPDPIGWWSPLDRGVLPLDALVVSRSLRRSCRDFEVRVDTAFADVLEACADPRRDGGWIDDRIQAAYLRLYELGWAHSVETWREGRLVGGLYGLAIGGLFAGESMFHHERDASKVALVGLVEHLRADDAGGPRLIDVQWHTDHLGSLGVVEMAREEYVRGLPRLFTAATPAVFAGVRGR
ncbi:leucyl/phenylalanyl-tRNA--protein transferase [Nocardioides sp. R-C-SC26]|uniref:leucyl/phenylalanyl-tRNA--protein transferase n=1 Tax=Nocardioides sp. R-C-SC26 TaxID=2870414 RepID=UPI001E5E12E6|nr:leucyl/phenylalanyl-tRNA--protein transferase [Nocardioides sp. R-C-SC26]